MKYAKLVVLILIFFGCNNQPKQPGTVATDSTQVDTSIVMKRAIAQVEETNRKTPPPLGMQNSKEEGMVMGKSAARALAVPACEQRNVFENRDTQVVITTAKTYYETDITIRKYNPTTPPVNRAPTANAGADKSITLPVTNTSLAGSGTDSDGTIAGYTWTRVSGGAATIATPSFSTTGITGLAEGVYVFRLTVRDNGGLTATDDVSVTVIKDGTVPPGNVDYMNLPVVGAQDFSGKSNIVFENKKIVGANISIKLYNGANNITIRNCFFFGSTQELVELENATNITIENCLFYGGYSGVYALGSKNIKIINCQFVNMRIKWIGGQFQGKGQFAQFNSCDQILVENCKGENFGEADPEDMISLYASSNATIRNNVFRGNPTSSWSASGGGIICGDNGGSNVVLENNTVVNPGNYGIAVAGGVNMKVLNNRIYSDRTPVSNNPLYAWAQGNQVGKSSNVTVTGNKGKWTDKNGGTNNGWDGDRNISNLVFQSLSPMTLSEMNVPAHLIDFITPADLLKIRGK